MKSVDSVQKPKRATIEGICQEFGLQRDAYYKCTKRYKEKLEVEQKVINLALNERLEQPRVGTRKLYEALQTTFETQELKVGRDCLFDILRQHDMLVKRKRASCKTTDSYHRFHKYNNLVKDMDVTAPNQVWVSDITYIRTINGFCYLALITGLYSRKIVGYDISHSLELAGFIRALTAAIKEYKPPKGLVHHSDRGVQYCSNQYVKEPKKRKFKISMTEENHCYENAVAERVIGILKDEFYLDQCFFSNKHAKPATKSAIKLYNNKRHHLSLGYQIPQEAFEKAA